jgi:hypothetical protein
MRRRHAIELLNLAFFNTQNAGEKKFGHDDLSRQVQKLPLHHKLVHGKQSLSNLFATIILFACTRPVQTAHL